MDMIASYQFNHANISTEEEHQRAIDYIKANKKKIVESFAGDHICRPQVKPISIFLAGAPGAGKTEFAKNMIVDFELEIVRIDADEIREVIPGYKGNNSDVVQSAAAIGVEKLYDYVLKKRKSCILDGTFANYDISRKNIDRSVKKGRPIIIFYIYQDPLIAWRFTKAREIVEGRVVPKNVFVSSFFNSIKNVNEAKRLYGSKVKLHIVKKNYEDKKLEKLHLNIDKVDNYIDIPYNEETLTGLL